MSDVLAEVLRRMAQGLAEIADHLEDDPEPHPTANGFIGLPQFAAEISVSEDTIYRAIAAHKIKAVKAGNRWRIPRGELARVAREGL